MKILIFLFLISWFSSIISSTEIHYGVKMGNVNLVSQLIRRHTIDINILDASGNAPLHLAAKNLDLDMVSLLLKNGAKAYVQDCEGRTPLMIVSEVRGITSHEIVKQLLKHRENENDINITDKHSRTALSIAVMRTIDEQGLDFLRFLLKNGAKIHPSDLVYALRNPTWKLNTMRHYSWVSPDITTIVSDFAVAHTLLNSGFNINTVDDAGHAAIHLYLSCNELRPDGVKLLVENKANVNLQDKDGNTPLHYLMRNRDLLQADTVTSAKILLAYGASIYLKNADGYPAFYYKPKSWKLKRFVEGYLQIIRTIETKVKIQDVAIKLAQQKLYTDLRKKNIL